MQGRVRCLVYNNKSDDHHGVSGSSNQEVLFGKLPRRTALYASASNPKVAPKPEAIYQAWSHLSATVPALRELRLANIYAHTRKFTSVFKLLKVNKTLQYIALTGPFLPQGGYLKMEERRRHQEQFQVEVVLTTHGDSLRLPQKIAFLITVVPSKAREHSGTRESRQHHGGEGLQVRGQPDPSAHRSPGFCSRKVLSTLRVVSVKIDRGAACFVFRVASSLVQPVAPHFCCLCYPPNCNLRIELGAHEFSAFAALSHGTCSRSVDISESAIQATEDCTEEQPARTGIPRAHSRICAATRTKQSKPQVSTQLALRNLQYPSSMSKNNHEIPIPTLLALPIPELRQLRQDRFTVVKVEVEIDGVTIPLELQIACDGWLYFSSPEHVYLEIDADEAARRAADCKFVLEDLESGTLFGCSLADVEDPAIRIAMSTKYRVYAQCSKGCPPPTVQKGTTRAIIESYGGVGVHQLRAIDSKRFKRLDPPASKVSVANLLAGHLLRFETGRVFIETHSTAAFVADSSSFVEDEWGVVVHARDRVKYYGIKDPSLFLGETASPWLANELGMEVFRRATSLEQVVPMHSSVLYVNDFNDTGEHELLKRLEVPHGRFEICENSGPSVGVALRRNDINYAALHGVFVRLKPGAVLGGSKQAYTVEAGDCRNESIAWTGEALAEFAKYPAFRAKFDVYVQCDSVRQVLDKSDRLMVDWQVLHDIPGPGREFPVALVRLYPVRAAERPEHAVHDQGYGDDHGVALGFLRGWYPDGRYWRMVGFEDNARVSGGTMNSPFETNITPKSDLGHARKRILVEIPGFGVTYCRGVGEDTENPIMACVLLNADSGIVDEYGFHKFIGRWNDIVK
ncbi:hypothetical protein PybrP1_011295 [[Pythium] brassicae (nom. inval.)]|nr:hypothetical protein PybrP1_011295 [[Pythium] brassicae (nom. inval.)]